MIKNYFLILMLFLLPKTINASKVFDNENSLLNNPIHKEIRRIEQHFYNVNFGNRNSVDNLIMPFEKKEIPFSVYNCLKNAKVYLKIHPNQRITENSKKSVLAKLEIISASYKNLLGNYYKNKSMRTLEIQENTIYQWQCYILTNFFVELLRHGQHLWDKENKKSNTDITNFEETIPEEIIWKD